MPYSNSNALNVFLSYASEDGLIAEALARALRTSFVDNIDITMMSEFPSGTKWRQLIQDSIAQTDLLIAIATGQLKPSHSFTGYEIGQFDYSLRENPTMSRFPELNRGMIPFAVLTRVPDTTNEFEGIDIDPTQFRDVRFDPTDLDANLAGMYDPDDDRSPDAKIYKLLGDIEDLINKTGKSGQRRTTTAQTQARIEILQGNARALCKDIIGIMLNREKEVKIPKSKLIIRLEPPKRGDGEGDAHAQATAIERATLRIEGPCYDAFGLEEMQTSLGWREFTAKADDEDIVFGWKEALNALISPAQNNNLVDNNVILSFDRKKIFRVFVSRVALYYSDAAEYQIYVVEMLRSRDQGDRETTILLKAMEVGLGYRFMFLEQTSQFSPAIFKATNLAEFKERTLKMLIGINLLLQVAEQYKLNEARTILDILGVEASDDVDEMYKTWNREKTMLYTAAKDVLRLKEVTNADKDRFIEVVRSFGEHTNTMNLNYTTAVLDLLQKRIEKEHPSGARGKQLKTPESRLKPGGAGVPRKPARPSRARRRAAP
jgi:hypothetical protein